MQRVFPGNEFQPHSARSCRAAQLLSAAPHRRRAHRQPDSRRHHHRQFHAGDLLPKRPRRRVGARPNRENGPTPAPPAAKPQRRDAFHLGINLILYAMTENYKEDLDPRAVHPPAAHPVSHAGSLPHRQPALVAHRARGASPSSRCWSSSLSASDSGLPLGQTLFLTFLRACVYAGLIFFLFGPALIDRRTTKLRRPLDGAHRQLAEHGFSGRSQGRGRRQSGRRAASISCARS